MPLSPTAGLARETRPLRIRLLGGEALSTAERAVLEEFVLAAASAVDQADTSGGRLISRALVAEHLDKLVKASTANPSLNPGRQPLGHVPVHCSYCGDWMFWCSPPAPSVPTRCASCLPVRLVRGES